MGYRITRLTPELAAEWLASMPEYQRKPNAKKVSEYAKDMAEGRWIEGTGETVKFNEEGQMVDGQHRCLAVIQSGVPVNIEVVTGIPNSAFKAIDRGYKRPLSWLVGGTSATQRTAIMRTLIALENGLPNATVISGTNASKSNPMTDMEIAEKAWEHDALVTRLLEIYRYLKSANSGRVSAAVSVCLASYAYEITGSLESFAGFCKDLNAPVCERPVICTMARERAQNFTVAKGKSKNAVVFAIYALAFQNWLAGETPQVIQTSLITRRINSIRLKRDWLTEANYD